MHGLVAAADSLRKVTQNNTLAARQSEFAARALGQLRARLEYAEVDDLLENLNAEMAEVQRRGRAGDQGGVDQLLRRRRAGRVDHGGDPLRCGCSIDHQTGFRYASPVKSSYNEARMTPAATEHQTVWSSRVGIEPAAWSFTYTDYWGTIVTTFELHEPHEELTVHAQGWWRPTATTWPGTSTVGWRPTTSAGRPCATAA